MNRTERLLDLITYLLNSKDPVSWRKIKNHFPDDYARGVEESNQRKFERDKAELISLGIPIDYQSGSEGQKEGYLIRKEKLFLPEILFSPKEFSLLMLAAGAVLGNEGFPYRDQLESALNKIISLQGRLDPAPEDISMTYDPLRESTPTSMIQRLQDALERRKWVFIEYHAFSTGEVTERRVDPYGLIFRRRKWTLVGWDHLRKDIRSFVVNRIRRLDVNLRRPGTADYEIPADFTLHKYQNQQPWEFQEHAPIWVTVEVSEHRLNELRAQLDLAESLGEGRFRLRVTNQKGLISWILEQKTDVRIVEPLELRETLINAVRKLA
ncbi:MAG: WYL domain-containing protein [Acidobacteriota bacterium]